MNDKKQTLDYKLSEPLFYAFFAVISAVMAFKARGIFDFPAHNAEAAVKLTDGFDLFNLYQNLTALAVNIYNADIEIAAGVVVFIFQMFYISVIHYWVKRELNGIASEKIIVFIIATVSLSGAIPNLLKGSFIYGAGLNTWHNPTSYAVRPFAIMCFFLFVRIIRLSSRKKRTITAFGFNRKFIVNCLVFSICLFLSVYAKISWMQVFLPAAVIFTVIWWASSKFSAKRLLDCLVIGLCFIPAGLLCVYTYFCYFPERGGCGIQFGLQKNIPFLAMAAGIAFALFVLVLRFRQLKHNYLYQMTWLAYLTSVFYRMFFIESGPRAQHGNLYWGIHYASIILLMVSLIEFIKYLFKADNLNTKKKQTIVFIGFILAATHLFSGLYYIFHIYTFSGYAF